MAVKACSWKKFYAERKHKYRCRFPYLKEDQIIAKLKRVWNKEQRSLSVLVTRTRELTAGECEEKLATGLLELVFSNTASETLQACQENVSPHQVFTATSPPHNTGEHTSEQVGQSPATHQKWTKALSPLNPPHNMSTSKDDSLPGTDSETETDSSEESCLAKRDFLCDMFSSQPPSSSRGSESESSGNNYCLFLNETDIFM